MKEAQALFKIDGTAINQCSNAKSDYWHRTNSLKQIPGTDNLLPKAQMQQFAVGHIWPTQIWYIMSEMEFAASQT